VGAPFKKGSNHGKALNVVAPLLDLVICAPSLKEVDVQLNDEEWTQVKFGKTLPGYLWDKTGGTSSAAPMVTALAALVCSIRPDLDHKQVIKIVEQGADDLGEPGWDMYTGYGRINFQNSLNLAKQWVRSGE